jgi:hypothetical protein
MPKIIATVLLKSNMAFSHLTCVSNTGRSKNVRIHPNQRPTVVSKYTSGRFVYCGCKASYLHTGSNYIDTVFRTMSLQARSL